MINNTILKQRLNTDRRKKHRSDIFNTLTHGCPGPRFTLTQLIIDTITCAITIAASMPPTDIIAM